MVLCIARDFLAVLVLMTCVTEGIEYKIDVVTADISWAGTDSSIYIELFGTNGQTRSHNLDSAGNDFQRGMTNNFVINDKDIGDLECIQLSIDGRDGFMFESITVVYGPHGSRHTLENTNLWLDDNQRFKLCNIKSATQYNIAMETSTSSWSGTDSSIFITLRGSDGTTAERLLDNRGLNDFQKGQTSNFVFNDKDIGSLRCISLRIDGTDGYRAKTITVVNEARRTTSSTDVDEWLDDNKRLEFCDIRQGTEYKITLRTSTRSWAGTDSGIYVILKGSNGNTKEHVLDTHNHNDFRKGNTDTYVFYDQSVGSLDCILFRNNGGDRWLVDTIKVEIGAYEYSTTNRNIVWLDGHETIKFCNLKVEY